MDVLGIPQPPPGDPSLMRAAADLWAKAADELDDATGVARDRVQAAVASWTGPGRAAFDQRWAPLIDTAGRAGEELRSVAGTLYRAADAIEEAQLAYKVAMGAAIFDAVLGSVAAVATLGASEIVALELAVGELLVAVGIAEEAALIAAAAMRIALEALREFALHFTIDLVGQAGMSVLVYPDHDPVGHLDLGEAADRGLEQVSDPKVERPPTRRPQHAEDPPAAAA
jgi:uncharacterized protein YukE